MLILTTAALCLREVGSVELVNDFAGCFHDVYSARRIRVTAERDLVVTHWKLQFLSSYCCYSRIFHLASDVLFCLIGMPWSTHG